MLMKENYIERSVVSRQNLPELKEELTVIPQKV